MALKPDPKLVAELVSVWEDWGVKSQGFGDRYSRAENEPRQTLTHCGHNLCDRSNDGESLARSGKRLWANGYRFFSRDFNALWSFPHSWCYHVGDSDSVLAQLLGSSSVLLGLLVLQHLSWMAGMGDTPVRIKTSRTSTNDPLGLPVSRRPRTQGYTACR